jgi:hypothetical protein
MKLKRLYSYWLYVTFDTGVAKYRPEPPRMIRLLLPPTL